MGSRMDAVWRVIALLWAWTVGGFIVSIVSLVGLLWMIVDVVWQLIVGSDGLSASSRPATIVSETLMWGVDLHVFAFTGKGGGFEWLPSV